MKIILSEFDTGDYMTFPMLPEDINVECGTRFQSYDIMNIGEIKQPLGEELTRFSWKCKIPGEKRQIKNEWGLFLNPYIIVEKDPHAMEVWFSYLRNSNIKCKLLITETPVNHNVYLENYKMTYSGGYGDYDCEISFQYCRNDNELNALTAELLRNGIEYTISEIDVTDILKFDGLKVSSEEEARKLIEPTLDEVKADKLKEISDICEETIYKGIDVTLSDGTVKHFSLKTEDQINLNGLLSQINLGNIKPENGVPYHADGEMCSLFSIADFTLVANMAMAFILQQTTYCNHLMAYIKSLDDVSSVQGVIYGQELTGEFLESYNLILGGEEVAE